MTAIFGIRREDKNQWEQRTPIIPKHMKKLIDNAHIHCVVQPSPIRIFTDNSYKKEGATIDEDLSSCSVIFAVKEIPRKLFERQKTYVFFSHVIKGQKYNMPMLKELMRKKCTLIDYEKILDEHNRRLIFFGTFAGISGMVDTLYTLGKRWKQQGISTPFKHIKRTYEYQGLTNLKEHIANIGDEIKSGGIIDTIKPIVIGFAGYGHVSQGAQEILNLLPVKEIAPEQLPFMENKQSNDTIYKVVFKEEDMVMRVDQSRPFHLQEYYAHPDCYQSKFHRYLPSLTVLMNCIYWDDRYPRLVTRDQIKDLFKKDILKLQVIGDISVDINGSIEMTSRVTTPDHPSYVYQPDTDQITDDLSKKGVAIMAVDNLPCELPQESSEEFSTALLPLVPVIVKTDYSKSFTTLSLPPEIKRAVIVHQGMLAPSYKYLQKFL